MAPFALLRFDVAAVIFVVIATSDCHSSPRSSRRSC
jgi:hypothetical protein